MLTLLDVEVTFCVLEPDGARELEERLLDAAGVCTAPVEEANFALIPGGDSDGLMLDLRRGTLEAPETGATAIYGVKRLAEYGGNLGATEAVEGGIVDALCSDYHPPSMLQAAFKLACDGVLTLPAAVGLVTGGPARAAGLLGPGVIREGHTVDLVLVGERLGIPTVTDTIIGGRAVSGASPGDYAPIRLGIAEQRGLPASRKPYRMS